MQTLPRGEIARIQIASDSAGTGGVETLDTVDFVCADSRRIQFVGICRVRSNVIGGVQCRLEVDGTQIQRMNDFALGAGKDLTFPIFKTKTFDAGTYTLALITGIAGINPGGQVVTAKAGGETDDEGVIEVVVNDMGPHYT